MLPSSTAKRNDVVALVPSLVMDAVIGPRQRSPRAMFFGLPNGHASAAGAAVRGALTGCLLHRGLLGAQTERCCGARQLQAPVRCNTLAILHAWILHNALREVCLPV